MTEKDARRIEDKLYRDAHRDEINARRRAWYNPDTDEIEMAGAVRTNSSAPDELPEWLQ